MGRDDALGDHAKRPAPSPCTPGEAASKRQVLTSCTDPGSRENGDSNDRSKLQYTRQSVTFQRESSSSGRHLAACEVGARKLSSQDRHARGTHSGRQRIACRNLFEQRVRLASRKGDGDVERNERLDHAGRDGEAQRANGSEVNDAAHGLVIDSVRPQPCCDVRTKYCSTLTLRILICHTGRSLPVGTRNVRQADERSAMANAEPQVIIECTLEAAPVATYGIPHVAAHHRGGVAE